MRSLSNPLAPTGGCYGLRKRELGMCGAAKFARNAALQFMQENDERRMFKLRLRLTALGRIFSHLCRQAVTFENLHKANYPQLPMLAMPSADTSSSIISARRLAVSNMRAPINGR
jgi:hypothetical protein